VEPLPDLVVAAQRGDKDAFGRVVERFQDMAYAVAYAMLGDAELARDAAQEAFIEAYLSLAALREPAAFPGWFRRIVIKQGDRQVRSRRATVPLDAVGELPSPAPDPAALVEQRQLQEALASAVAALPAGQRLVVAPFYISGYSQKEIAEFLELPVTTVKKRLHTARARLKERILAMLQDNLHEMRPSHDDQFAERVRFFLALKAGDLGQVKARVTRDPTLLQAQTEWGVASRDYYWPLGWTALHWAAAIGDQAMLRFLLEAGGDVNARNKTGLTPLHVAALMRRTESTQQLLEAGADVEARTASGLTPLTLAVMRDAVELAAVLLGHGAQAHAADGHGRTPRDWAVLHGQAPTLALFDVQDAALQRAVSAPRPGVPGLFETGIKVVDLCAPCSPGGETGVFTPVPGVGQYVLLGQLIATHAERQNGRTVCLGLEDGAYTSEGLMLFWREWGVDDLVTQVFGRHDVPDTAGQAVEQGRAAARDLAAQGHAVLLLVDSRLAQIDDVRATLRAAGADLIVYYGDHTVGAEPAALTDLDAEITFDVERARQGLWPAVDPLRSRSRLLEQGIAPVEHTQVAATVRQVLLRAADLHPTAAGRDATTLDPADRQTLERAARLQRFLTQPFDGAEPWTGRPGETVALADTLRGCRAILAGETDGLPEDQLYVLGALAPAGV
jgi:RNA polymerase sigma factor (sigma-70 family)